MISGWWFGTCFIFLCMGGFHHPNWLSYFSEGVKPVKPPFRYDIMFEVTAKSTKFSFKLLRVLVSCLWGSLGVWATQCPHFLFFETDCGFIFWHRLPLKISSSITSNQSPIAQYGHYPLVMTNITMERSTIFVNGKIHGIATGPWNQWL